MDDEPTFSAALRTAPGGLDQLDALIDQSPFGVFVSTERDGGVYVNPAFCRMFGLSRDACLGFGWARVVHPDDMALLQADIASHEETREPASVQYRVVHDDGTVRWLHARVHAVPGPSADDFGSVCLVQDVTDQRTALQTTVERQKLETVGKLAGRVAHDFNNLLTALFAAADLLESEALSPDGREQLQTIGQVADHARQLTDQLLSISRRRRQRTRLAVLDTELERMLPLLQRAAGEGVRVRLDAGAGRATAPLDAGQLGQVVLNLVTNASEAMRGRGEVHVASRRDGQELVVTVRDTGPGIDAETLEHAFEPFFTTRQATGGTGLGLTTVRDIVEASGGSVRVDSTPGEGACVTVELRAWRQDAEPADLTAETLEDFGGSGTVLMLEDNAHIRVAVGYALALHGYDVVPASTLAEARSKLAAGRAPDAVVCDLLLPDGRGPELVAEVRAEHGTLPVVYVSGFGADSLDEGELARAETVFLPKPYSPKALLGELKRLTAGRADRCSGA